MSKSFVMGMACLLGFTVVAQDVPVQGIADPAAGGKVTGSAVVKPGKSVTLTASPTKGWAFIAWQDGNKAAKRAVPYAEALASTNEAGVAEYTAAFMEIASLPKPVVTAVDGVVTGMVGVAFSFPVGHDSLCAATLATTKLPGGLALKNGVITGVPKKAETVTLTLTASNPAGKSAPVQVTVRILPLPLSAQGTFTGCFLEEVIAPTSEPDELSTNLVVVGTLTMTVSASGKISAKTLTDKGKVSFSAPAWAARDGTLLTAELKPSKGKETLALTLDTSFYFADFQLSASLAGGVFEGTEWGSWVQKKSFSNKQGDEATEALVRVCYGYYTAVFFNQEMTATGNAANTPQGYGYCTVALSVDGSVKIAGKLADGKAFSGSTTLLLRDPPPDFEYLVEWLMGVRYVNIPVYVPMYGGPGKFSCLLMTKGASPSPVLSSYSDLPACWIYPGKSPTAKVPQTEDAFEAQLGCAGSVYFSGWDLSKYYTAEDVFMAGVPDLSYTYVKGGHTETVGAWTNLLPNVPLNVSKMTLPTGKAPVWNAQAGEFTANNVNPAQATFSLTKKSGVFKGKFNVYYEYTDEKGAQKLKTVPVKHEGVVLPIYTSPSAGGFYLMPDTWVDNADPKKPVTYKLNRSFGVAIALPDDEEDE